jgi:hypothetical protein
MLRMKTFICLFLFMSINSFAVTASKVYEKTKDAIVVVYALDKHQQVQSQGSGVVVDNGVLLTNKHVVDGADSVKIYYKSNLYDVEIAGFTVGLDVAVLYFDKNDVKIQPIMVASKKEKIGSRVYALGSPKGLELTLSDGIISSYRNEDIQITAPISPGSSGGALLSDNGALLGITTFKVAGGENLNFAIDIHAILDKKIIAYEKQPHELPRINGYHLIFSGDNQTILINSEEVEVENGLVYYDEMIRMPVKDSLAVVSTISRKALDCSKKLSLTISSNLKYLNRPRSETESIVFDTNKWTAFDERHEGGRFAYKALCQYKKSKATFKRIISKIHAMFLPMVDVNILDFREYLNVHGTPITTNKLGQYLIVNNPNFSKIKEGIEQGKLQGVRELFK